MTTKKTEFETIFQLNEDHNKFVDRILRYITKHRESVTKVYVEEWTPTEKDDEQDE